jgi:hypothetical protein
MRRRHLCCAILLIAACSHKTPDQKLLEAAEPAASWTAALQMTAEKWLGNSVPSRFVRATVDAANAAFDKTESDAAQSDARQELRDAIKRQLEIAQAASGDFKQAVGNNDRRVVANCARRFAAAHSALQQLEDQKDRP